MLSESSILLYLHFRLMQHSFHLPGPPHLGLSLQFVQLPQSCSSLHGSHAPRLPRFRLITYIQVKCMIDKYVHERVGKALLYKMLSPILFFETKCSVNLFKYISFFVLRPSPIPVVIVFHLIFV